MKSQDKTQDQKFPVDEVVAAACAAFRINGFVKRDDPAVYNKTKIANSNMLYTHFYNDDKLDINDVDRELASTLVEYLKGLSFKAFERSLTSFETNVLKFVTSEEVGKDQIGIAASLPSVFERKLEADAWSTREAELARTSDYIGMVGSRCDFVAKIENLRFIGKTSSWLVSCSVDNKDILKFFTVSEIGKVGDTINVGGFVKSQAVSTYSNAKETMINRIKIKSAVE